MQKAKTGNGMELMEVISKEPRFRKFGEAIKTSGLAERFSGTNNYTVFAPTDDAFNRLPQDKVNALLQPENREHLKNLLLLHIVPGTYKVDDLKKADVLKTEAGREIKVDAPKGSNEIKIENARVTETKKEEGNWFLYGVDAVLQPTATATGAGA